ncbi:MAG: D-inositol 3-phosphate glycosyltransferase [Microgenomates bacterium OLB22]|nr:MAG: D-inositol 3-phosphate glycosyltransferase [Microgenomates bacterium OLB22]
MLGSRTDSELAYLYDRATALIMPQEEDFGYTPIEALFFGTPTIAYGVGGASETVREGKTGLLVADQTPEAFVHIISEKGEKIICYQGWAC